MLRALPERSRRSARRFRRVCERIREVVAGSGPGRELAASLYLRANGRGAIMGSIAVDPCPCAKHNGRGRPEFNEQQQGGARPLKLALGHPHACPKTPGPKPRQPTRRLNDSGYTSPRGKQTTVPTTCTITFCGTSAPWAIGPSSASSNLARRRWPSSRLQRDGAHMTRSESHFRRQRSLQQHLTETLPRQSGLFRCERK